MKQPPTSTQTAWSASPSSPLARPLDNLYFLTPKERAGVVKKCRKKNRNGWNYSDLNSNIQIFSHCYFNSNSLVQKDITKKKLVSLPILCCHVIAGGHDIPQECAMLLSIESKIQNG